MYELRRESVKPYPRSHQPLIVRPRNKLLKKSIMLTYKYVVGSGTMIVIIKVNVLCIIIIFGIMMTVYTFIYFLVKMVYYFNEIFVIPIDIIFINTNYSTIICKKLALPIPNPKLPFQSRQFPFSSKETKYSLLSSNLILDR